MTAIYEAPKGATWVRFPRFVGDAVMQLPILRLLRRIDVGPIVVWGPAPTASLACEDGLADFVVFEEKKAEILELTKTFKEAKAARSIHFPKSLRTPIAAWLAGVPERIGVSDGGARLFNTHHAPFWKASGPFVLRYHAALAKLWPDLPPMPFADYHSTAKINVPSARYICLMPGSAWLSKSWPVEHYQAIALKALQEGMEVAVLGSLAEKNLCDTVLGDAALNGMGHNYCGQTNLREAAATLQGAVAAIGNDSGLSHLAAACGTKTIALYGPTDSAGSAPWGPDAIAVSPDASPCRPCFKKTCPLPRRTCMEDITPDMVWGLIKR
ncbi:MAG: glycosyltransferase family 9 protein [Holophagales bacterium]|jgi:lipopolysaccharide heptosyltransferase II|nr:glycosyltransferase family 9 protein [Holophagales bacterium]